MKQGEARKEIEARYSSQPAVWIQTYPPCFEVGYVFWVDEVYFS